MRPTSAFVKLNLCRKSESTFFPRRGAFFSLLPGVDGGVEVVEKEEVEKR
jgi:hypothetical protein